MATLFCVFESASTTIKEGMDEDGQLELSLYIEEMFGRLFYKIFPEYAPEEGKEFDLVDAAIIKAQDDIIKEAHKKGISFDEALHEYNEKAKEYVNARKMS